MVRSEKEIREKMEVLKKSVGTNKERLMAGTLGKFTKKQASDSIMYWLLKWVLEGEPRYSASELDRLYLYLGGEHPDELTTHGEFRKLLKDKARVEAILNEGNKARKV